MNFKTILNSLALLLSGTGMGFLASDLLGIREVPDEPWVQGVYVLAILGGLAWRALPDQNGTPGPDILEGQRLDWRVWAKNILRSFAFMVTLTVPIAAGCGAAYYATRVCTPAYSDNCLVIEGTASRRGTSEPPRITQTPDASVSVEAVIDAGAAAASGAASYDPVTGEAEAHGCAEAIFWAECISTGHE